MLYLVPIYLSTKSLPVVNSTGLTGAGGAKEMI